MRDRFEDGRAERRIDWVEIEAKVVVRLVMVEARTTLRAVDLRGEAPLRLGIPSDVVRAREHRLGRAFGEAIFTGFSDVDAILFGSRLTGRDVIAVRGTVAAATLHATPARPLMDHDELPVALEWLGIKISASPVAAEGHD